LEIKIKVAEKGKNSSELLKALKLAAMLFVFGGLGTTLLFWPKSNIDTLPEFLMAITHQGLVWIILWMGNAYLSDWVGRKISWTERPVKRFVITVITTIVYTLGSMFVFFMLWSKLVWGNSFKDTLNWIDIGFFYTALVVTAIVALFLHGRGFLLSWREAAVEAEQLKRANISSQFEALKSQVNPHFLFNSLNVLSSLVYKDQDLAAAFIKQLSNVYRYVLDMKDKELVTIKEELQALEAYLFLAKIRFGDNLEVTIDIPDQNQQVAPLTLQMLVENAIKHNIVSAKKPLQIEIGVADGFIYVKNNLQKKMVAATSSGIGLPNIQERYRHLSDKKVEVMETLDLFTVKIPILNLPSS
jgi:two-component system LytT family sensor kinase